MGSIKINIDGINSSNIQFKGAVNKVGIVKYGVHSIRYQIDSSIRSRRGINGRLNSLYSTMESIDSRINRIVSLTSLAAQSYKNADDLLAGRRVSGGISTLLAKVIGDLVRQNIPFWATSVIDAVTASSSTSLLEDFFGGKLKADASVSYKSVSEGNDNWKREAGFLNAEAEASLEPEYGKYEKDDYFTEKKQKEKTYESYVYDKETGQYIMPGMVDYAKKTGTIAEVDAKASAEVSLLKYEESIKGEYGSGSVSAKVAAAEAHASVSAGFYVYDKDGKQRFAPGVNAEVGASVCALAVEAEGLLGSENLGIYGKGEASAGKAEAKAQATMSIFNEDGSLNIQAKASASAEAIAVEAKGSAGVTVLGTEVGVTGSVNVGVGAHADVGIIDGKVKVDIGASLGVGFSVGFEVDVSGTVDAVCGAASDAWNTFTSWF